MIARSSGTTLVPAAFTGRVIGPKDADYNTARTVVYGGSTSGLPSSCGRRTQTTLLAW